MVPVVLRNRAFGGTVFFHRDLGKLLCTDMVLEVTDEAPVIFEDKQNLMLYHVRKFMEEEEID